MPTPILPKASYSGEPVPAVGTPEYAAAQNLSKPSLLDRYAPGSGEVNGAENANKLFGSGPGSSMLIDTGAEQQKQRAFAQSAVNAVRDRFDSILKSDEEAKTKLANKAYLGSLLGGRGGSPSGATEEYNASQKGQDRINEDLKARDNEINTIISNADARGSVEFEEKRKQYLADQKDAATKEKELSGTMKTTAQGEISTLSKHGVTYDDFVSKYGEARARQYMKDLGVDENGLRIQFMKDKPDATKVFEKQVGDNYVIGYQDPVTKKISTETIPLPKAPGKWSIQKIGDELWFVDTQNGAAHKVAEASPSDPKKTSTQLNEESDGLNWLARQTKYSPADKEAFQKDETFRAYVINQSKLEKQQQKSTKSTSRALPPKQ